MLDTALCLKMSADWRAHVAPGDVVTYRFPLAEVDATDRPKARPCLVLEIEEIEGKRFAVLAYGTTSRRRANVGEEIRVHHRAAYRAAGLDEPTRFVGRRRVRVPLDDTGFAICGVTGSAVLGRLDAGLLQRMQNVCARIRDLPNKKDTRRKRRMPWGPARRGIDFIVEARTASQPQPVRH